MVDMEVMDMVFGDVRRGKLKPNLLPNLPLKLLPNLVTTMAMDMDLGTDTMADTTDLVIVVTMDMDIFGDVRRGRLKPNPLPNLPPKPLPILIFTMVMDMDTMEDTMDLAMAVTMDVDIFGDVRRGKLKPNPLPNLLRIPTSITDMDMDSAMVDTTDMALDTMDMALDTMDAATIGENKSQIHRAHYQHSASKCLDGNNDDLSFCCRTHSL